MEEDKIVLDRKSFEALAVDTRVRILKSLKERRKTLSEIAKEQGMSVSGVKEHLETLEKVGLIVKKDDGHKWKYYELTRKGNDIVAPRELRVWILLSISMIAFVTSMIAVLSPPTTMGARDSTLPETATTPLANGAEYAIAAQHAQDEAKRQPTMVAGPENQSAGVFEKEEVPEPQTQNLGQETQEVENLKPDLTLPLAVAAVSALTLIICTAILLRNRMKQVLFDRGSR